jgi:hypothetical protein
MDLEASRNGAQAILRIPPTLSSSGQVPAQLVCTLAGSIGLCGVNAAGVGVVVNNLWQLADNPVGLPVAFVVRGILACRTWTAAAAFVERIPHASGQAYTIIGTGGAVGTWECSAAGTVRLALSLGRDGVGFFGHTNHPLAASLAQHWLSSEAARLGSVMLATREVNSRCRMETLRRRLKVEVAVAASASAVQAVSASAPGGGTGTTAAEPAEPFERHAALDAACLLVRDTAGEHPICRAIEQRQPMSTFFSVAVMAAAASNQGFGGGADGADDVRPVLVFSERPFAEGENGSLQQVEFMLE